MLSIKGHVVSCPLPQAYQEAASLFLQNNMGIVHKEYLDSEDSDNNKRIYACSECHTHLSTYDRIISTVRRPLIALSETLAWKEGHIVDQDVSLILRFLFAGFASCLLVLKEGRRRLIS